MQKTTLEYLLSLTPASPVSGVPGLLGSPFPKFSGLPRLTPGLATSGPRSGPGPAYITCNCGQSFASLSQLERHMSADHPDNTNLVSNETSRG